MRNLVKYLLCILILFATTESLKAGGCYASYPSYSYPVVQSSYPTSYVTNNIVNRYTVFDFTPGLAVGYYPEATALALAPARLYSVAPSSLPQSQSATSGCDAKIAELNTKLAASDAKFAALEARLGMNTSPPPMSTVNGGTPQNTPRRGSKSAFTLRCASCHDESVAEKDGGKLVLAQNGLKLKLPAEIVTKALRQMMEGKMPKNGKLTNQEFTEIMAELLD